MSWKKIILFTSLLILFTGGLFISLNTSTASVISNNYKHYKAKYKNKEDKQNYFKMKTLRKDNNSLFFFWKNLCETHKYDTDAQFETLPQKTQDMCQQYYSYKGYKKYVYWRNEHDDNDDDETTTTAETPFVCGTDTVEDADGNIYDTVEVNDQCWMAENLNVGTMLASAATEPADNSIIEKWCYDNDSGICDTDGGLYNWNEAMQYVTTEGAQGICPSEWHIPTDAEQYDLENYLKDSGQTCSSVRDQVWDCSTAGTKLKSGGSSGMNFLPSGALLFVIELYYGGDVDAWMWSSSQVGSKAWVRYLWTGQDKVQRDDIDKSWGLTIRCLKD